MNLATLLLGLLIKPAVLIMAIVVLFQLRSLPSLSGRRALVWGTLAFFVGEMACGVNVYGTKTAVLAFEGTHELMMAVSMVGWIRGLHLAALQGLGCLHSGCEARDGCQRLALGCERGPGIDLLSVALLLAGVGMVLVPTLTPMTITDQIFEAGFGAEVMSTYSHHRGEHEYLLQQLILPWVAGAALLLATGWSVVKGRLDRVSWWLLHIGAGVGGFAWLRLVLSTAFYPQAQKAAVVEEVFELVMVVLLAIWLRSMRESRD
jgi:hypothetical protein